MRGKKDFASHIILRLWKKKHAAKKDNDGSARVLSARADKNTIRGESMENIEKILNPQQLKGVTTTEGPVLILAGAGSGKTRVLTHRVAYLMQERQVEPYHIMAITFTNKAAGEMRRRINNMAGPGAEAVWVATFHSTCVRILRRFIDRLGYDPSFSIYDADDSKTVMKEVIKKMNLDPKKFKEKYFLSRISAAKNELIPPESYANGRENDPAARREASVYREYQARLKANGALDFDDLLMLTVELFKLDTEVLNYYQDRFRYVMVDEYQDTNTAQFEFVRLLCESHHNLCVVGDDDQSIYKFRGANIRNILDFERHYPEAEVIRLEQNYRSTKTILEVANNVIANNAKRKVKRLWTENEEGARIVLKQFDSAYEEAEFIANDIAKKNRTGEISLRDTAVLYRTNAQSRLLEEKFLVDNIPYRIVGGVNFYQRKEIKDVLAYLKTIDNPRDDVAVRRIINVPKRGIGATTISRIADYAYVNELSFYEALTRAGEMTSVGKAKGKIAEFVRFIEGLKEEAANESVANLIRDILDLTGYQSELELEGTDEAATRIENLGELYTKAVSFEMETEEPTLAKFLENVALIADIDRLSEDDDYVVLMTLHSAKGLEFDDVYLAGMEDGLFPSFMSITADNGDEEVEEERRLCYVGITRAKKHLTMTCAKMRMVRGETQYAAVSRFVKEIPKELMKGETYETHGGADYGSSYKRSPARPLKNEPTEAAVYQKKLAPAKDFGTKIIKQPLSYGVGDTVVHRKFGTGVVKAVNEGGKDYEVTIDFEDGSTRKMFASFAKLEKV